MTLYEKIKPEILENIYADSEKYPLLVKSIINDLKDNISVDDLKFITARYIHIYSDIDSFTKFDLMKIYEAFGY